MDRVYITDECGDVYDRRGITYRGSSGLYWRLTKKLPADSFKMPNQFEWDAVEQLIFASSLGNSTNITDFCIADGRLFVVDELGTVSERAGISEDTPLGKSWINLNKSDFSIHRQKFFVTCSISLWRQQIVVWAMDQRGTATRIIIN
uniref:Uncharacterized protein n=1 Tax=Ciona savignyi TaxID=51511 RepID=H2ZMH1_CIOSA